jgi:deoxyribose-phosphate aldolase
VQDIVKALGLAAMASASAPSASITRWSQPAVQALAGSGIPVAAVRHRVSCRPHAAARQRLAEIREFGGCWRARSIDIVITRAHVLTGRLAGALRRGRAPSARPAASAHVKAILATGDLETLRNVAQGLDGWP